MKEPLLWNSLDEAAMYLAELTNRDIDARGLIDIVINLSKTADPSPTIISAVLPRDKSFAKVKMGQYSLPSDAGAIIHEHLNKSFGLLPRGLVYTGLVHPKFSKLPVNSLIDLLVHGEIEEAIVYGDTELPDERIWVMPWGTTFRVGMDSCGLNKKNLIELGRVLCRPKVNEQQENQDINDAWQDKARAIANELREKDRSMGTQDSKTNIAERVADIMRKQEIRGIRGFLSGKTVLREALSGDRWKYP